MFIQINVLNTMPYGRMEWDYQRKKEGREKLSN